MISQLRRSAKHCIWSDQSRLEENAPFLMFLSKLCLDSQKKKKKKQTSKNSIHHTQADGLTTTLQSPFYVFKYFHRLNTKFFKPVFTNVTGFLKVLPSACSAEWFTEVILNVLSLEPFCRWFLKWILNLSSERWRYAISYNIQVQRSLLQVLLI